MDVKGRRKEEVKMYGRRGKGGGRRSWVGKEEWCEGGREKSGRSTVGREDRD
jgi:hypothetical protein